LEVQALANQDGGGLSMGTQRLDWMKFNVYDFAHSEDVQMMTAEEVGQYVLLLIAAWTLGKECTIPNEPRFLDRTARGPVSAAVLARFKEKDGRLFNEAQVEVWHEGKANWTVASEAGKRGNEKRWAKTSPEPAAPIAPRSQPESGPDRDLNRCDVMRKEKNASTMAIDSAEQRSVLPSSLSHHSCNSNGNSQHPEDGDLMDDFLPWETILARYFYNHLPSQNQEAAPELWEKLWSKDLAGLKDDPRDVYEVMDYAAGKKDKSSGERIYVRAQTFVNNYAKLKAEALKVKKAKTNGDCKVVTPVPPPTPKILVCVDCKQKSPANGFRCQDCLDEFDRNEKKYGFMTAKEKQAMAGAS